jgi:hypothetical protein
MFTRVEFGFHIQFCTFEALLFEGANSVKIAAELRKHKAWGASRREPHEWHRSSQVAAEQRKFTHHAKRFIWLPSGFLHVFHMFFCSSSRDFCFVVMVLAVFLGFGFFCLHTVSNLRKCKCVH